MFANFKVLEEVIRKLSSAEELIADQSTYNTGIASENDIYNVRACRIRLFIHQTQFA